MKYLIDEFFSSVTLLGMPLFYFIVILLIWRTAGGSLLVPIFGYLLVEIIGGGIKFLYRKDRPLKQEKNTLIQIFDAGSFPSTHTARVALLSTYIFSLFGNDTAIVLFAFLITILVGYSRIRLKKHYLVDVIGGLVLGISVGIILFLR